MPHYLFKEGFFTTDENVNEDIIGYTLNDIENGLCIKLNNDQIDFLEKHPDHSYKEIYLMQEESLEKRIERVRNIREECYKKESDPIYISYQKYSILNQSERAEEQRLHWLSKIKDIEQNNPYPIE